MCRHTSGVTHTCYTYTHLNPWAWVTHTALHTHICTSRFRCLHRCTCAHSWLHTRMERGTWTHVGLHNYVKVHARAVTPMHNSHTATHLQSPCTTVIHTHRAPSMHACTHAYTDTHTHKQTCCLALTIPMLEKSTQAHRDSLLISSADPQVIILVTMVSGGHSLHLPVSLPPSTPFSLSLFKEDICYLGISFTGFGDFPGGPVAKIPCFQCRWPRFNPWLGN